MARGGHGGHHGGSWKVAYADFITSMFALFLVLWLVSADEETRKAVQDYFRGEKPQQGKTGFLPLSPRNMSPLDPVDKASKDLLSLQAFNRAMERMRDQLKNSSEMGEDLIRFEFTADGVRINALDNTKRPFFQSGTSELTDFGKWVLQTVAMELERFPVTVEVEGHTQKNAEATKGLMPWDLSTTRAMSAQNALADGGVKPGQFWRVAGYGDRVPLEGEEPDSEKNRRITLIVKPKNPEEVYELKDRFPSP